MPVHTKKRRKTTEELEFAWRDAGRYGISASEYGPIHMECTKGEPSIDMYFNRVIAKAQKSPKSALYHILFGKSDKEIANKHRRRLVFAMKSNIEMHPVTVTSTGVRRRSTKVPIVTLAPRRHNGSRGDDRLLIHSNNAANHPDLIDREIGDVLKHMRGCQVRIESLEGYRHYGKQVGSVIDKIEKHRVLIKKKK